MYNEELICVRNCCIRIVCKISCVRNRSVRRNFSVYKEMLCENLLRVKEMLCENLLRVKELLCEKLFCIRNCYVSSCFV